MTDLPPETLEVLGEPWITADEVVEIAGVKPWMLQSYPPIPKLKVGGLPRFRRSDAELWRHWEAYRLTLLSGTELAGRLGADPAAVRRLLRARAPWYDAWGDLARRSPGPIVILDGSTPKVDPRNVEEWREIVAAAT